MTDTATPRPEGPIVLQEPMPEASEPVSEARPEAALIEPDAAPPVARKASGGSTVLGLIVGAALAVGAGYGVQRYLVPTVDGAALDARLAAVEAMVQTLSGDLGRLSDAAATPPPVDQGLLDRITALETAAPPDGTALTARVEAIESNLAALANAPTETGVAPGALAALQAEVAALKSGQTGVPAEISASLDAVEQRLTEAEARAAELATQAQTIAATATRGAALTQMRAAFDSGAPFGAALADLGDAPVPEALRLAADGGVPTVQSLQASFPDAARAALTAALTADMGESWTDRVAAYLRNQTGARSLTPREGTDPDAILSRAEAALAQGDVATALTEIAALPPAALAAMEGWRATAQRRLDAQSALADLGKALGE